MLALAEALVDPDAVVALESAPAGRLVESVVPVTSMRWPTWFFSSASCPSRTYVLPRMDVALPVVPAALPVLSVVAGAPVPDVDVELDVPDADVDAVPEDPDDPDDPDDPIMAFVRM